MTSRGETMPELLYHVTEDDEEVGSVERAVAHADGLLHRSGLVFLLRPDARILIQHRSPQKATFPAAYDASAAFHVTFGESYEEAAERELREETGVSAPLRFLGRFTHHDPPEHQIVAVFLAWSNDPIRIDPSEATGYELLTRYEVDRLVREGPVTPWLRHGWSLALGFVRA